MSANAIKWICLGLIGIALCLLLVFYILGSWHFQSPKDTPALTGTSVPDVPISNSPAAQIVYSFGLEPLSDDEYQAIPEAVVPSDAPRLLPAVWSLAHKMPPAGAQGHQGSCTAWAVAYALKSYQEEVERNWGLDHPGHLFSPAYVYNQLNRGRDRGISIKGALNLLSAQGCATLAAMPYNSYDSSTKPSDRAKDEARSYKIASWARINKNQDTIKQFLVSGYPLIIGIMTGSNLGQENLIKANYIYRSLGEEKWDWHAAILVGYNDEKSAYRFLNSWGTDWGENGYAWIDYDFFPKVCREIFYCRDAGEEPVRETREPGKVSIRISPPNAPSNLRAEYFGLDRVYLTWNDNSDNEAGFIIEQRTEQSSFRPFGLVAANVTTYLKPNLAVSTTYYYRIRADNVGGYSDYSNEVSITTKDISQRIIVVRNDICDGSKRFDGNYDRIEDVLKRWRFPHTVVGKSEFDKDSYLLDDKIMVIFNCNRHGNHCCNPNHTIISKEDGTALKCQGAGDCLRHNTKLSDKSIEKIRQFVGNGGCLFTEDRQFDEIISRTFKNLLTYTGVYIDNSLKWEEETVKVLPVITNSSYVLLDGIFDGSQTEESDITIKIHNYSTDIKILDKDTVTVLLMSPDVSGDDNDADGIVAVTFKYYSSPEKYGRVVHLMGHLTGQGLQNTDLALVKLLVNLLRDYNARGGK
ncbi:MAG: hypothetical protein HZA49_00165 [Planctomycetes bacterium]|nr:hypothetical protein [Planctomycetota bacterium]